MKGGRSPECKVWAVFNTAMDGSIDKGLREKDNHAAIRSLAIEMSVSISQGEKCITDVPMVTAKRNLIRDHSLETDIQIA